MCKHLRYYHYDLIAGKKKIDFSRALTYEKAIMTTSIAIKCGNCSECQAQYTNEWAIRIMKESLCHDVSCVLTLTYDNEHCPREVCKRDIDTFIRHLRQSGKSLRYFYVAEYGDHKRRPHYHCILFGYCPSDLEKFFLRDGIQYYTSQEVSHFWKNGYILVSHLTEQSARYCAFYLQKQLYAFCDDNNIARPFVKMSLKPGIGYDWCVRNIDKLILDPHIYYQGKAYHLPRYFVKIIDKLRPGELDKNNFIRIVPFEDKEELNPYISTRYRPHKQ